MRIFNREVITMAREKHADAARTLDAWLDEAGKAAWARPLDLKHDYASASFLPGNVVIFNLKGNRYRLAVRIDYVRQWVFVIWFGTHGEYDRKTF